MDGFNSQLCRIRRLYLPDTSKNTDKYRDVFIGHCQKILMKFLVVNYFRKKAPSQMFGGVLNTPVKLLPMSTIMFNEKKSICRDLVNIKTLNGEGISYLCNIFQKLRN